SLSGRAALIERSTPANFPDMRTFFFRKIEMAAGAGAMFAVVYNNVGTTELLTMATTEFVPIPAVFIGHNDGVQLQSLMQTQANVKAQLVLNATNYQFAVTNKLICEHVVVRLKTDHTRRGDVRITL